MRQICLDWSLGVVEKNTALLRLRWIGVAWQARVENDEARRSLFLHVVVVNGAQLACWIADRYVKTVQHCTCGLKKWSLYSPWGSLSQKYWDARLWPFSLSHLPPSWDWLKFAIAETALVLVLCQLGDIVAPLLACCTQSSNQYKFQHKPTSQVFWLAVCQESAWGKHNKLPSRMRRQKKEAQRIHCRLLYSSTRSEFFEGRYSFPFWADSVARGGLLLAAAGVL